MDNINEKTFASILQGVFSNSETTAWFVFGNEVKWLWSYYSKYLSPVNECNSYYNDYTYSSIAPCHENIEKYLSFVHPRQA